MIYKVPSLRSSSVANLARSSNEVLLDDRLDSIIEKMKNISQDIESRVRALDLDIISTRNDPQVKTLWNKLCMLHMRGVVICEDFGEDKPAACSYIYKPQACVQVLHLTEEETCCNRFFKRKTPP